MLCLECKELIVKNVTYKNIFKPRVSKICNSCFTKYIYIQELLVLPINNYKIYLNVLFDRIGNPYSLMEFIRPYYIYYLKEKLTFTILYFDSLDKVVYNILQNISFGNIYIIVLHNNTKKENDIDGRSYW